MSQDLPRTARPRRLRRDRHRDHHRRRHFPRCPNLVARSLGSVPLILAVWIFAGVVSFFGALACAELGAALPATGGQYIYLRDAYGPIAGFLCGWIDIHGRAVRAGRVAGRDVRPLRRLLRAVRTRSRQRRSGIAAIALFPCINYRGVHAGAMVQKLLHDREGLGHAADCRQRLPLRRARRRPRPTAPPVHAEQLRRRADRLPAGLRRMGAVDFRRGRNP